jgi:hypothetical protein
MSDSPIVNMLRSLEMLWRFAISQSNNANGERMTEAQEQQLERRLTKLCQMD